MVQLPLARSESLSAFKDDSIYMEKCIECPRHVEIQILADKHGNIMHLGSRDCSIQRRHQKLLEIAPAELPEEVLTAMYDCAVNAAREAGYVNAGTVEFLVDARTNEFWFMEMNTRLQVEHTVTEELTGIDIVREQIRIAEGGVLSIPKERIHLHGGCRCESTPKIRKIISCPREGSGWRYINHPRTGSRRRRVSGLPHPHGLRLPPREDDRQGV